MGSRLFEEGDFCNGLYEEKQLWLSFDDCLQFRLTTNFIGQSDNSVYTKSGLAGIIEETLIPNLYKTFIKALKDWKTEEVISDYAVFPYDWRGELDDILKSGKEDEGEKIFIATEEKVTDGLLYKTITELANNSNSGKVTIVAHSNGGLVIKQLLSNLQNTNDSLLDKIDNVILVAVPQLGAPADVVGVLHGEEIFPVFAQVTTRRLMNTMPFAHHLLPTTGFFDSVQTPVITFEPGEATNPWINRFGSTISDRDGLHQFLSKDSGRPKPTLEDLQTPEVVDDYLLNYARTTEIVQNNFVPKDGMKVYQIAGVGLETPSTLEYFSDRECVSTTLFFLCTEYKPKVSYRVEMTVDGDGTVLVPSALSLAAGTQVERRWLNLFEYNDSILNFDREHKDILEVPDIINFISNTIQSTTTLAYNYLSDSAPQIDEGERLIFQLHSPLDMYLVTAEGRLVSSSTNEIDTAVYRRYGELQYISIPRGESVTLLLRGLATGSFTLDVEEVSGDEIIERVTYSAIPSSINTKVTMEVKDNSALNDLLLLADYDSDGANDVSYDPDGVVENEVTYDDLFQTIDNLELKRLPKLLIVNVAKVAQKFYEKTLVNARYVRREKHSLELLLRQVELYERLHLISYTQRSEIEAIVNKLLNNG